MNQKIFAFLLAGISMTSTAAFAQLTDESPVVSIPDGSQISFTRDVEILPNNGAIARYSDGSIYCVLYTDSNVKDRVVRAEYSSTYDFSGRIEAPVPAQDMSIFKVQNPNPPGGTRRYHRWIYPYLEFVFVKQKASMALACNNPRTPGATDDSVLATTLTIGDLRRALNAMGIELKLAAPVDFGQ